MQGAAIRTIRADWAVGGGSGKGKKFYYIMTIEAEVEFIRPAGFPVHFLQHGKTQYFRIKLLRPGIV